MPKAVTHSISLPLSLSNEIRRIAKREHRTQSGVVQEAVRAYIEARRWRELQRDIQARARELGLSSTEDIEALVDEIRS